MSEDILAAAARGPKRDINVFTVPPVVLKEDSSVTKVGFVLLTLGEEKMAADRGVTPHGVAAQQVIMSLRLVNNAKVSIADGSAEQAFAAFHPKLRALCSNLVNNLHGILQADADVFMASREVVSG